MPPVNVTVLQDCHVVLFYRELVACVVNEKVHPEKVKFSREMAVTI